MGHLKIYRSRNLQLTTVLLGSLFLLNACGHEKKKRSVVAAPTVEALCKDGKDNDNDGKVDCDDPDCQSPGGDCNAAPALDRTVASTVSETAAFLYSGTNPLQRDADPKAFDSKRVAMFEGTVVGGDGKPLAGVRVTVQDHKEYGYTFTRADGAFALAVNGGTRLLLDFAMDGYLSAQRSAQPGWQRHLMLDAVGLVAAKGKSSHVSITTDGGEAITGQSVNDEYGAREPLIVFEPGTVAEAVMADGSKRSLSSLSVSVTEYPIDASKAYSPGTPTNSAGLSYGLEFEVAEANQLGASHVEFSSPVSLYVENFLELPVGTSLPIGYYDRSKGQWEKGKTGRVVEILDIVDGSAVVDVDGTGAAATTDTLDSIGITASDLIRLADRYKKGAQLWHGNVSHFSGHSVQVPVNAPKGASGPSGIGIRKGVLDRPSRRGSALVEYQAVQKSVPVTGTPYALEFQSHRSLAYKSGYQLELPLTSGTVPKGLKRITARVSIAGQTFNGTFEAKANQKYTLDWNGLDAFARLLQGPQSAQIYIGYVYDGVLPNGAKPSKPIEVVLGQTFEITVGVWDAKGFDLGGFALNVLHSYDPSHHTLFFGNGDQRGAENIALVTKPANADSFFNVGTPDSIFVDSDGSIVFTDDQQQSATALGRLLRIAPDGKPSIVAGPGASGAAAKVELGQPQGIVALDDGSFIVADKMKKAIRRIDPDGKMTTLVSGTTSDNPQVNFQLANADGIALGLRQELYIVDAERILVLEAGKLSTFAGGGAETSDGGLATDALLVVPSCVVVTPDGIVYVSERGATGSSGGNRIRKVLTDGTIVTIAGTGAAGFSGDGAAATDAQLSGPRGLALGPDGSVYVVDQGNNRIRRITTDGLIQTVIGGGTKAIEDGKLATDVALNAPDGIAMGPDGTLYIATMSTVFRVAPGLPTMNEKDNLIPSSDGRTLYRFDYKGKHLATIDAMTGVTELTFNYDNSGYLTKITDKDGLTTEIQRGSDEKPSAIKAPYGQVTTLATSEDGTLAKVTDPINRTVQLTWDASTGTLTNVIDPRGNRSAFSYDVTGRLTDVTDPTGYEETFASSMTSDGYMNVSVTTKEGKVTKYLSRNSTPDTWQRGITLPDGTTTNWEEAPTSLTSTQSDGTKVITYLMPDTAFGPQSMVPSETITKLPSGKTLTTYPQRSKKVADISNPLSLQDWLEELDVNGRVATVEFSRDQKTLTTTSPMGRTSTTTLDSLGRAISLAAPGFPQVAWTYDRDGRVATMTRTAGTESRTDVRGYGDDGWISGSKNALGEQIAYNRDLVGRPKTITRPDNKSIAWTFDDADNVTALIPPGKAEYDFAYAPSSHLLTQSTAPRVTQAGASGFDSGQQSYEYSADKSLTKITHSDGRSIALTYSQTGKLASQTLSNATLSFGYDSGGTLTSINRSDGVKVELTHDGSLWTGSTWSNAITGSVKATYDSNLWLSSLTVNNASTVNFTYDDDGLLIGASSSAGSMSVARDANTGLVTGTSLGNVTTSLIYNGFAEPSVLTAAVSGSNLFGEILERDSLGRITHIEDAVGSTKHELDYGYDNLGRLTSATRDGVATTYTYDSNGNRTSVQTGADSPITATFDAQDRIQTFGTQSYNFSPHGDLLSRTDGTKTLALTYDELGNLMTASLSDGAATRKIDYVVDGFGRRVARKIDGAFDRAWLYRDNLRPVSEVDSAGVFTHYVYADSQSGAPDFMIRSGVLYRIIKDQLGSVRMVVNAQTGAVAQSLEYDAFGRVLSETGAGFQAFGFAGGLYDAETKLVRFGARDYDPGMGRWTTKDLIGFAGGDTDVYAYVGNDPVNAVDPDGLAGFAVGFGMSAEAFAGGIDLGAGLLFDFDIFTHKVTLAYYSRGGVMTGFGFGAGLGIEGTVFADRNHFTGPSAGPVVHTVNHGSAGVAVPLSGGLPTATVSYGLGVEIFGGAEISCTEAQGIQYTPGQGWDNWN